MSARDRILERVRAALSGRPPIDHPGPFAGWRPDPPSTDPVSAFIHGFEQAGGEAVRLASQQEATSWLATFAASYKSAAVGATVPAALRPQLPDAPPERAPLGVSMARGAAAETGSLILDSRDGRMIQLLPPTHVVFVPAPLIVSTLTEALNQVAHELPSALGLHSGPSKSADIGQVLVKGVHGPGRVLAAILEYWSEETDHE